MALSSALQGRHSAGTQDHFEIVPPPPARLPPAHTSFDSQNITTRQTQIRVRLLLYLPGTNNRLL